MGIQRGDDPEKDNQSDQVKRALSVSCPLRIETYLL